MEENKEYANIEVDISDEHVRDLIDIWLKLNVSGASLTLWNVTENSSMEEILRSTGEVILNEAIINMVTKGMEILKESKTFPPDEK